MIDLRRFAGGLLRRSRLPERMLVSIHLPKTGGSTLTAILRANFREVLAISGPQDIRAFLQMSSARRSAYPAVAGHMPLGIDRYVTVPCKYIIFVREPVDHAISSYYYVLRTPANPQHERASKMSLREYAESDVWPINDNPQTRWLSSDWTRILDPSRRRMSASPGTLELQQAKASIDRCDVVGLYDRFEECVRLCCDRFGLTCGTIPRLNATAGRPAVRDVDPEVRAIIRERRRLDCELHEYAARRCAR
jgi:Sulfotransferase family